MLSHGYRRLAGISTALSALLALLLTCRTASAQSLLYNIPAEPLSAALRDYARESGRQIVFTEDLVRGRTSQELRGSYSTVDALKLLLRGTGLVARLRPSGAIMIERKVTGQAVSPTTEGQDAPDTQTGDQTAAGPALGEVIVTAQKYQERAFDVPISMSVVSGPDLQRLGITNLQDLQYYVPGMFMQDNGDTQFITIQGVSNFFGQGALVGTYLDEADVTSEGSFGLDLNAYDLARVEVLKGPQGTLYGEGSLGGTIRYITNKPALDAFQMGADVTALFDQYGAPEERVETMVNAPIVAQVFGLRVAADLHDGGGWIDQPAANQKNINSKNLADVRIEGRWQPRDDLTVEATEVIHRETSGPHFGEDPPGIYTQVFNLTTTPSIADSYNISNLTLNWESAPITVVNSATYFVYHDSTPNWGISLQLTPPPSPRYDEYDATATRVDESLSDELRLSGSVDEWRWMLGGFYKRLDDNTPPYNYYIDVPGPPGSGLPPPYPYYSDIYSSSRSVFGDTSYRLFDRLTLGVGMRYFTDDESAFIFGDTQREKATFTSSDPRFYAQYAISREMNIYASAAKGFRSGGFNGLGVPQYQPEHVWTYELGTKMRLLDDRLSVDSDFYVSDYGAYQIIGVEPPPAPPLDITRNAGDARIKGGEIAAVADPGNGWRLGASADYINARFVEVAVLDSAFAVGDPLDYVPRYQIMTWAERDFRWRGRSGFTRIDYTQRSPEPYRNRSFGPWYYSQSGHMYLLGFHTGINWTRNLRLEFFVQNLLNDREFSGPDSIEMYAPREQPRTFGVSFSVRTD